MSEKFRSELQRVDLAYTEKALLAELLFRSENAPGEEIRVKVRQTLSGELDFESEFAERGQSSRKVQV